MVVKEIAVGHKVKQIANCSRVSFSFLTTSHGCVEEWREGWVHEVCFLLLYLSLLHLYYYYFPPFDSPSSFVVLLATCSNAF